ncbi:SMI1/KNR4 family protein [Streptosporangium sp. NPDC002524]|uniref:SMI1/KNR4 family protein n=1 Tax=Streptosporangium sp. NPDC002524 TaxID=3154537 RepID=UPI0033285126
MLRLITSRRVRLALAAAALVAGVVAVARLWRRADERRAHERRADAHRVYERRAGRRRAAFPIETIETVETVETVERSGVASPAGGPDSGAGRAPRWPPAPVLGTPTDEDLRRYAAGPPSSARTAVERMFEREPRTPAEPLDEATRGRLVRWGAIGIGLCLLVFGTQVLESAVFSNGGETVEATDSRNADEQCETDPDVQLTPGSHYVSDRERRVWGFTCVGTDEFRHAEQFSSGTERYLHPVGPVQPREIPVPEVTARAPVAPVTISDTDCRPRARTPRVRAIDPRVTRAVNHQWRRVERWLEANAPATLRTLGKPARARTIAVAEAQMGLRFPADLRASLLRHDGAFVVDDIWPFGFLGNRNHGVREIRDTWRRLCGMDGEVEGTDDDARTEWWDGRMIPFGSDGSGDHLVIDSVVRDVGGTDHEGMMSFLPGGVSVGSYYRLLRATADVLETGGSIGHWKPVVTGGELNWKIIGE